MHVVNPRPPDGGNPGRERQLALLIQRLPSRIQPAMRWLRQPSARWVRIPVGVLLMAGSVLSILPVFGLWMLPLGMVLLAEDFRPFRKLTDRVLIWIEQRRPHWMGLAPSSYGARPEPFDPMNSKRNVQ